MVWHLELGVENKGDPYLQGWDGGLVGGRNDQIGQVATSWRQIERREVVVTFGGQMGIRPYR